MQTLGFDWRKVEQLWYFPVCLHVVVLFEIRSQSDDEILSLQHFPLEQENIWPDMLQ